MYQLYRMMNRFVAALEILFREILFREIFSRPETSRGRVLLVLMLCVPFLSACSQTKPQLSKNLQNSTEASDEQRSNFGYRNPVEIIQVPGDFFVSKPVRTPMPSELARKVLSLRMPAGYITFDDLFLVLEDEGITISYRWDGAGEGESVSPIATRQVPFRRFDGTLGELMEKLALSSNISYSYNNGAIFVSQNQRYNISMPQNEDLLSTVQSQLQDLGVEEVVSSEAAGQVSYIASIRQNEEVIKPFLQRLSQNLSEITIQVAVVELNLNDTPFSGFSWSALRTAIDTRTPGGGTGTGTTATGVNSFPGQQTQGFGADALGSTGVLSSNLIRNGVRILGARVDTGITLSLNYLSQFGRTRFAQNVEMRTLAGQEMRLRAGRNEPRASTSTTISNGTNDNNTVTGEIETLETGLELTLTPNFDATNGIVTTEVTFTLSGIAGTRIIFGEEQPITTDNELDDIVRLRAGEAAIIGGLTTQRTDDSLAAPFGRWKIASGNTTRTQTALFIIMRPTVTIYQTPDNILPSGTSGLNEVYKMDAEKTVDDVPGEGDGAGFVEDLFNSTGRSRSGY